MNEISLYYTYSERGPGRVIENLKTGLNFLGYNVIDNPDKPVGFLALLQDHPVWEKSNNNFLCGPNIFAIPTDNKKLCEKFQHFVCPSLWVQEKYRQFDCLNHATIDIWPVGIDTDMWSKKKQQTSNTKNVILYTKHKSDIEVDNLIHRLSKMNVNVRHIKYGSYTEEHLKSLCSEADACVLLTGTESQGIAYMQILSCGIPCYVIDTDTWVDSRRNLTFSATSVPYFDESCGVKVRSLEESTLTQFLEKISEYDPRDYIVKNHDLKTSAASYISIMQKYNCRVW